jgi:hypothetical protein
VRGTDPGAGENALAEGALSGVTYWQRHESGWTARLPESGPGQLLLVDIDVSSLNGSDLLLERLGRELPGLDDGVLCDLLDPDTDASFKRRRRDKTTGHAPPTQRASLFVVKPDERRGGSAENAVLISLGLIEFAVGESWVLVARHPAVTYIGGAAAGDDPLAETADVYLDSLLDHGLQDAESSESAALAVINQAVYSLGQAKRDFYTSLELWRTASRTRSPDKGPLVDLQATLPLILHALEPLQHPTVMGFVGIEFHSQAREVRDQVERDIEALRSLQVTVAAALAQVDQEHNELDQAHNMRYQASLAKLAGVFLAPALVASIFGANQMLADSPVDLVWLFLAMLFAGVLTWIIISYRLRPSPDAQSTSVAPAPPRINED